MNRQLTWNLAWLICIGQPTTRPSSSNYTLKPLAGFHLELVQVNKLSSGKTLLFLVYENYFDNF